VKEDTMTRLILLSAALLGACSADTDDLAAPFEAAEQSSRFVFATDPVSAYTRVDRAGMPAVNTALIASKDAYNAADPIDDINGDYVPEIIASLAFLHTALDDDLAALSLTPCTVVGDGTGTCVAQGAPLVLPDTLKIDFTQPAGFPNGRMPSDPVVDVTLAVVLLDLAGGTHGAADLVGALNPPANDVPFLPGFPYLAAANP
jgi:hypothetical protein